MPIKKRTRKKVVTKDTQYHKGVSKIMLEGLIIGKDTVSEKIQGLGITTQLERIKILVNRKKYKVVLPGGSNAGLNINDTIKCFVSEHVKKLGKTRKQVKYLYEGSY